MESYSTSARVGAGQKANRTKLDWVEWMGLGTQAGAPETSFQILPCAKWPPNAISLFSLILLSNFV